METDRGIYKHIYKHGPATNTKKATKKKLTNGKVASVVIFLPKKYNHWEFLGLYLILICGYKV